MKQSKYSRLGLDSIRELTRRVEEEAELALAGKLNGAYALSYGDADAIREEAEHLPPGDLKWLLRILVEAVERRSVAERGARILAILRDGARERGFNVSGK